MSILHSFLIRLGYERAGATVIEYCIVVAAIAIVVVVAYSAIGQFPVGALENVAAFIG